MPNQDPTSILGPDGEIARRLACVRASRRSSSRWPGRSPARSSGPATWSSRRARAWARASPTWSRRSRRRSTHKKKVVVSTHTIALQEQLLSKDIPFLRSVMGEEFSAVLVKGRSNYISLRRLDVAIQRRTRSFQQLEEIDQLATIRMWSKRTTDGSRSDLTFGRFPASGRPCRARTATAWAASAREHKECFFYQARRRVQNANMLIVNHALFVTDLALRGLGDSGCCPNTTSPSSTRPTRSRRSPASTWACKLSSLGRRFQRWRGCTTSESDKGLLAVQQARRRDRSGEAGPRWRPRISSTRIADWYHRQPAGFNGRVRKPIGCPRSCPKSCARLATAIDEGAETIREARDERIELDAAEMRCRSLADEISAWLRQAESDASTGSSSKTSPGSDPARLGAAGCRAQPAQAAVRQGPDLRADLGDALRRLAAEVRLHQVAARA